MYPDFNKVARPYDFMSRLVFGNALVDAQVSLLGNILPGSRILIVGGGTGWILEEISKVHESGLEICYVEISSAMITLSKKKNGKHNRIIFFQQPVETFHSDKPFDVIITPFFFDLFKRDKIETLFNHLDQQLRSNGFWLYTDFIPSRYQTQFWHKALLKTMYLFFSLTSKVEAGKLIDMDFYFGKRYVKTSEMWFYRYFIRSAAYIKR
jgi:ubiquinone/menaquinone biosynthesis C-methylase UbiE